jgi:hypothetical protein
VQNSNNLYFRLESSIDLTEYLAEVEGGWKSILVHESNHTNFDGNRHKIMGFWTNILQMPTATIESAGLFDKQTSFHSLGLETDPTKVVFLTNPGNRRADAEYDVYLSEGAGVLCGRDCSVTQSYVLAHSVSGPTETGILVGSMNKSENVIQQSYAIGTLEGRPEFASNNHLGAGSYIGGLVGQGYNIEESYAATKVTGISNVGSLLGGVSNLNSDETPTKAPQSFYDATIAGNTSGYGKGLSSAEMKTSTPFTGAGWTTDLWCYHEGFYPRFWWQNNLEFATVEITETVYTGSAQTPEIKVSIEGMPLTEDMAYTITGWANNTNAGTATVTILGTGTDAEGCNSGFFGTLTKTFPIKKVELAVELDPGQSFAYTGSKQMPQLKVLRNGVELTENTDYTIECAGCTGAGTYTIGFTSASDAVIKGKTVDFSTSNFTSPTAEFTIAPASLTFAAVADQSWQGGAAIKPVPFVYLGGKPIASTEFTVAYTDNTDIGQATLTLQNASGSKYDFSLDAEIATPKNFENISTDFLIVPATITVIPNAGQKKYPNAPEPTFGPDTYTLAGWFGTDGENAQITGALVRNSVSEYVGQYPFALGTLEIGNAEIAAKYTLALSSMAPFFSIENKKSGNTILQVPDTLYARVGFKQTDIELPKGWNWSSTVSESTYELADIGKLAGLRILYTPDSAGLADYDWSSVTREMEVPLKVSLLPDSAWIQVASVANKAAIISVHAGTWRHQNWSSRTFNDSLSVSIDSASGGNYQVTVKGKPGGPYEHVDIGATVAPDGRVVPVAPPVLGAGSHTGLPIQRVFDVRGNYVGRSLSEVKTPGVYIVRQGSQTRRIVVR